MNDFTEVPTILVVDDEIVIREMISKILSRNSYQIILASDGFEALNLLEQNKIDVVMTDMKMPGMDGMELIELVKKNYPDMKIIVMTAFEDIYTIKDAIMKGADEYITKPFNSYEINMIVERAYWSSTKQKHKDLNIF